MSESTQLDQAAIERRKLNVLSFWPGFVIITLFMGYGLVDQAAFGAFLTGARDWVYANFGWMNVLGSVFIAIFCFAIAFSPIGDIRLGGKDAKPEYTIWQWFSMSLCACIGIGILFWAMGEPIYHLMQPPLSLDIVPGSKDAGIFAISQATVHWTIAQYGIYTICGLAIALVAYNRRYPLAVASGMYAVIPERYRKTATPIIHAFCIFSLCSAVGCSMGAGLMQISSGTGYLFGYTPGPITWACTAVLIVGLYTISCITGVKKGMRILSSITTSVFFTFLLFILIIGPTLFILSIGTESFGYFVQNFFRNSTLLNTMQPDDVWPANWLIPFMASFYIFGPLLGLFLCRLGKGRTVRQFLLVNILAPSAFCFLWLICFGGTAIYFQWSGIFDIWQSVQDKGLEFTVFAIFSQFPGATFLIAMFTITVVISFVTLADPNIATLATISTKGLQVEEEAPKYLKLWWGCAAGTIAYLLVASGGIKSVQGLWAVAGFPMMFMTFIMCVCVVKDGLYILKLPNNFEDRSKDFE